MSHILIVKTKIRDGTAVRSACRRLKLPEPVEGTFKLFSGEATGLGVRLPDWRYPAVCDLSTGEVRVDHFQGRWGDPAHLDRFLQTYAAEKVKLEARRKGHSVTETRLADGSIRLVVRVQGGDA